MNIDITKTLAYSRTLLSAQALVLDRLQDWLLETWRSEEDFDDLVRSSVSSAMRYCRLEWSAVVPFGSTPDESEEYKEVHGDLVDVLQQWLSERLCLLKDRIDWLLCPD